MLDGEKTMDRLNYDAKLLRKLKEDYFTAKAIYEVKKELAEVIQRRVLEEHAFYETDEIAQMRKKRGSSETPKRILNPFDTYLMDQEKDFQKYLDLTYAEYLKEGVADPRGKEYIPEAEEKALYHKAEKQLIDYAINIIPDGMKEKATLKRAVQQLEYRDKVLDLILKLKSN